MAFQMKPGRSPFKKTGHGIPSPFLQGNISSGEDLRAQAKAKAEAEAKAKQSAAGENLGGSSNIRTFEGTGTVVKKGQQVEKYAKTPEEIAKWKAAPKENKAKYKSQTITEKVKLTDIGKDKPESTSPPTTPTTPKVENYGMWHKNTTAGNAGNFGGGSTTGRLDPENSYDAKYIEASQLKDYTDKYQGPGVINRNIESSSQNKFELKPVTKEEDRISRFLGNNMVSPYDTAWADKKGENIGTGEAKRQEWIKGRIDYINKRESEAKTREDLKNQKIAEAKQKAEDYKKSFKKSTTTTVPVAMQLKNKSITPMKQTKNIKTTKVSKKTAYDIKEASNQKLKPSARKHYAENAQAAMKNKKSPAAMKKC